MEVRFLHVSFFFLGIYFDCSLDVPLVILWLSSSFLGFIYACPDDNQCVPNGLDALASSAFLGNRQPQKDLTS